MTLALDDRPVERPTEPRPIADRPPRRRLGRRAHRALLVSHVLASVGWFGLAVTVAYCAIVGSGRGDVSFYAVIDSTLSLSVPLGLLSASTGVALSLTSRWGVIRHWWVVAKEAVTIAVIATDVLVIAPSMGDAVERGRVTEIPGAVYAHCIVLAIATVLSLWKPRARTPYGNRATRS